MKFFWHQIFYTTLYTILIPLDGSCQCLILPGLTLLKAPSVRGAASSHDYATGTPITGMLKIAVK